MKGLQAPYLERLDHLRFYAAALVVLFHFFHNYAPDLRAANPLMSLIDEGHTGIGLFMVISGFVFTYIARGREVRYAPFLFSRFVRIYPLFVFAVFLQLMISTYNEERNYGFLALLGWLMPFRSETVPLSQYFVQLWTIWVEFQFYLLFPFLHAFALRYGQRYLIALLGLFILTRALVFLATGSVRFLAYETIFGRMDQFLIGMLAARLYLRRPTLAANPLWLLAASALAVTGVHGFSRIAGYTDLQHPVWIVWTTLEGLLWAGVLLSYLNARLALPRAAERLVAALGATSFSIYVMHNLVIAVLKRQVGLLPIGADTFTQALWTGLLIAVPATLALAALTYLMIERPFFGYRLAYVAAPAAEQSKAT
jgi:peptidoglycan/LPS O-acetylase OafA/YrhL